MEQWRDALRVGKIGIVVLRKIRRLIVLENVNNVSGM